MLSVRSHITRDDIAAIGQLVPAHLVYLLTGHQHDKLVVKQEGRTGNKNSNVEHNLLVMSFIDPNGQQLVLDASEVSELRLWVTTAAGEAAHASMQPLLSELANRLSQGEAQGVVWTKMPFKRLVNLDSAVKDKDDKQNADKTKIRQLGAALAAPGGLEKLGEIVAADLFNGNQDRFSYHIDKRTHKLAPQKEKTIGSQYRHLANLGNLLVALDGPAQPTGLDSFDPTSNYKSWTTPLTDAEKSDLAGLWPGRVLAPCRTADLHEFAVSAMADLEQAMGPRHRKIPFATKSRLGKHAAARFQTGLERGRTKIVQRLRAQYGRQMPTGLADRLRLLNM
ncbi:MAG TPA: hypothetical protein VGF55_32275 [Gemmataceae bacterium]